MTSKTLCIGADPFPPYQYYGEDGAVYGLDYDKVIAAFQKAGYEVRVELHDWPIVEQKLNTGEFSAAFQVQPTPERLERYCFSRRLRDAATELVSSKKELTLREYGEITEKGLSIGVLEGYTNGPEIDALPSHSKRSYPDAQALLLAISRSEVDLGVFDQGVKAYLMEKNRIDNIYVIEPMTFSRPLHVIFLEQALCEAFDAALVSL